MKKLLLVDVPEDRELVVMTRRCEGYISIIADYKEITLPTDEEIKAFAESTTMYAASAQNRIEGARWAIEQITEQV